MSHYEPRPRWLKTCRRRRLDAPVDDPMTWNISRRLMDGASPTRDVSKATLFSVRVCGGRSRCLLCTGISAESEPRVSARGRLICVGTGSSGKVVSFFSGCGTSSRM